MTGTTEDKLVATRQSNPVIKFCSTDEFWEAMCSIHFIRESPNQGRNARDGIIYLTDKPPESADGFMENKLREVNDLLTTKRKPIDVVLSIALYVATLVVLAILILYQYY